MKNLSIRFKLLLLVSIPLTSVIISSLLSIKSERESHRISGQLVELTELAGYSGSLVHELQKERGATAIFLQSQGRTYKEELQQQHQNTNAALDSINAFLSGFDVGHFDPSFAAHMSEVKNKLNAIPDLRESISSLTINPGEAIGTYTSTNTHLLETVGIMMTLGDDVEMSNLLASYFFFMQSKERAGIERAVLSQVFAKGFTTQADIMKFSQLVEAQEAYIKSFQTVATPAHISYYGQQMGDASVSEVQSMRSVMLAGPQNGGYSIEAPEWFATITKKINLLKDVETRLEYDLLLRATAHQQEAFQALLFTSSMSLLIIILSILICVVVIRSISNPIQTLEAAAEEVANGNASVQVPIESKDEIGHLSESFNAMVVSIRDSASKIAFEQQQTKDALEAAETSRLNAELAKDEALASKSNAEKALRDAEVAKAQAMEAKNNAEKSKSETEAALKDAEAAKAEAMEAQKNAEASKLEAEKALVEAEASKAEALEAKSNAEASKREAVKALEEAEASKAEALEAKKKAEASKSETEAALKDAEAAKAEAMEAQKNAEASKQEAEKALVEAEASKAEALEAKSNAEASKKEAEKALVEAEASKAEALEAKKNAEASQAETEAALKDAEVAKAEAMEAQKNAEASKQEAEKALVGAEASKAEALQAKHNAEASKQEAEKALIDAEASKASALEAQKKAVASKTETEKALKEAEMAQADAMKAKTGAEASQKEAEQALVHAERSKAEALQAKHDAELAMKEVAATQQRVEKAHRELEGSVELMLNVIDKFAKGDMTVRLPKNDNATINRLFRGFNDAASTIGEFINKVNNSVADTQHAVTHINSVTEQILDQSKQQASRASSIASAAEEMAITVTENAKSSTQAADLGRVTGRTAMNGSSTIKEAVEAMKKIETVVRESSKIFENLGRSSSKIGSTTSVIERIAGQTKLLALNARIEAVHAQSSGDGFAVVANEVRQLAEETTTSTLSINDMIRELQSDTHKAIEAMQECQEIASHGTALSDKALSAIHEISSSIMEMEQMVQHIASAVAQQQTTSNDITQNIVGISSLANESQSQVQDIVDSMTNLGHQTDNLSALINTFKTAPQGVGV